MKKLIDQSFVNLVAKLANSVVDDPTVSYRLGRLHSAVVAETTKLVDFQLEQHKKFGEKDDKGKVIYREEMKPSLFPKFKSAKQKAACDKACEGYFKKHPSFVVRIKPIPFASLRMMTPADWAALEDTDLVEGLPGIA